LPPLTLVVTLARSRPVSMSGFPARGALPFFTARAFAWTLRARSVLSGAQDLP
jgi:hypothetical protein